MDGRIFEIKHFAVHDGPGIRTTVFFKGCPLKCLWCHNPEGIDPEPQLAFFEHKCTVCRDCLDVCPNGAHEFEAGAHKFNRSLCLSCGKCAGTCFEKALTLYGRTVKIDELLPDLLCDRDFYESSGGGVTLSGGECLLQKDFCVGLLKKLKENGIHTAVDTCGFVSQNVIKEVMPYTDLFLYDIKAYDNDVHEKCTGKGNGVILENLRYIVSENKDVEIRIPYVPSLNGDQISKIGGFLSSLPRKVPARVLPYHDYLSSKYRALGKSGFFKTAIPTKAELDTAKSELSRFAIEIKE